ncbi:MspA family porin [Tsukamurella sp. 8F]|uniref:MspA family porin n=1 Tax=unclassified Tsukamurella TaxID=2633480 RepID=UPI0023B99BD7|nr:MULTISPECIES: MspA family porin [unclassified Tsukamurella]MDF0530050.1 MspA family porin [Tsukamurella sp. 8J]MDF0586368.1 MspA family porin [Tsukamurella sp. 8F]
MKRAMPMTGRGRRLWVIMVAGAAVIVGWAPTAQADTWQKVPDNTRRYVTPEKVTVTLKTTRQVVNRIVSVAPNQLSHMGYFSGISTVTVAVPKGAYGPPDGILQAGLLVGCQADLSSGLDVTLNPSVDGGVAGNLGAGLSVTPSIEGSGGVSGQTPSANARGGVTGTGRVDGSVSPDVNAGITSSFKFVLKAGQVTKLVFSQRLLNAERSASAVIQYDSVEVVVDQCGGAVKARSFATFVGSTDSANIALNTRGGPVNLFSGV